MNLLSVLTAVAAMILADNSPETYRGKEIKDCLQCGKNHQHNNAFCSRECSREYRKCR